jgi:hypothetical protein
MALSYHFKCSRKLLLAGELGLLFGSVFQLLFRRSPLPGAIGAASAHSPSWSDLGGTSMTRALITHSALFCAPGAWCESLHLHNML